MIWYFVIFSSVFGIAEANEELQLIQLKGHSVLRNEVLHLKPVPGHHFSLEAPQDCGSGHLVEKSPRLIQCQFLTPGVTKTSINVCDDKKTFCRPIALELSVSEKMASPTKNLILNEVLNKELKHSLVPGFTQGSPTEITKQAGTRGQPVFVMVSTDWCPPCNEAKEYLLSSPAFQKATQNWFKVYVDGDSFEASVWEKVVRYRYYPSFILLNSRMEEVGRYNGELRQSEFENWAKETNLLVKDPISALRQRVEARLNGKWRQLLSDIWRRKTLVDRERDLERLMRWALDQEDQALVAKLEGASSHLNLKTQWLNYQLARLTEQETMNGVLHKKQKSELFEQLLQASFKEAHWGEYLARYCDVDLEGCKTHLAEIPERLNFLNQPRALLSLERESQLGDETYYLALVYQATGNLRATKETAKKCVQHFEVLQSKSLLKTPRASQQGMVACLELAGDFRREQKLLKNLIAAYPTEPTFLQRMARMQREQKNFASALQLVDKAEQVSYGYNWFTLQLLKVEVLLDLKQAMQAKVVLADALKQIVLEPDRNARNQRLVARLRSFQTKIENSLTP